MDKKKIQLAMLALAISFFFAFLHISSRLSPYIFTAENSRLNLGQSVKEINPFDEISLEAKSAYVFDLIKKEPLFELNSGVQLPLASLTKIMTAVVAKESAPSETVIIITKESIESEGDDNLLVGEKWRLSELLDFVMIRSSNDGACAIAAAIEGIMKADSVEDIKKIARYSDKFPKFIYLMNKKAKEMNLNQTYFLNETGLDISENLSGAYSSASDVAKLVKYALADYPEIFEATSYESVSLNSLNYGEYKIKNTNRYAGRMPQIIGSKTGFTDLAGGNLAVVFDAGFNRPIIAVVMGSSIDGRFSDMQKLITATLKRIQQK